MQLVSTLSTSMNYANSSLHCRIQNSSLSLVNFDSLSKLAQCAWNSLRENKDMSESKMKERVELGREAELLGEVGECVRGCTGGFCTVGTHVHTVRHTHISIVSILK